MRQFFIFDTETTGLATKRFLPNEKKSEVIEFFGHIVLEDGTVQDELEFLCKPGKGHPVDWKTTTRITGLTPDDVNGQPPFSEFVERVADFCGSAPPVAHNLSYDKDMVNIELSRIENAPELVWQKGFCTVEETMHIKGHRLSLSALHEHLFGEKFEGAHRARVDVNALTRCFLELLNRGDI